MPEFKRALKSPSILYLIWVSVTWVTVKCQGSSSALVQNSIVELQRYPLKVSTCPTCPLLWECPSGQSGPWHHVCTTLRSIPTPFLLWPRQLDQEKTRTHGWVNHSSSLGITSKGLRSFSLLKPGAHELSCRTAIVHLHRERRVAYLWEGTTRKTTCHQRVSWLPHFFRTWAHEAQLHSPAPGFQKITCSLLIKLPFFYYKSLNAFVLGNQMEK